MKSFKKFLGPEATKDQDRKEIVRQKVHLSKQAKEYHDQSDREGGGGAAEAKGDSFEAAKKNIHTEEFKVGDRVKPSIGPHAGEEHEVIHVHADGRVNIKPTKTRVNKYHLGAAAAQPHHLEKLHEDGGAAGVGGGMNVAAIAGSGDSRLPASQREPGVSKKRNPVLKGLARRLLPKV